MVGNNKEEVKLSLEHTLKYAETSVKNGIENLVGRMERLHKDIQHLSQDNCYDYDKRVYNIIHEIQWTLANMNFESLAERAAEYKAVKRQIDTIKEFETAD